MKKLVVMAAVAMLTASTVGCESCQWFRRGAFFPALAPAVVPCDPCLPMNPCDPCDPCDPCATGGSTMGEYLTPPAITPGPGTYIPAPTN